MQFPDRLGNLRQLVPYRLLMTWSNKGKDEHFNRVNRGLDGSALADTIRYCLGQVVHLRV
ncbi:MAG TPA: hypothetical protein GX499_07820 [Clostridiales bacterium]|nr:hypothetical protein [Clostridiales bacterium]